MNNSRFYTLAGAAAAAIGALLFFTGLAKDHNPSSRALRTVGLLGLGAGVALAYQPEKQAKKNLEISEILNERDVELVRRNLREVLGNGPR